MRYGGRLPALPADSRRGPFATVLLALVLAAAASPAVVLPPPGRWTPVVEQEIGQAPGSTNVGDLRAVGLGRDRFLLVWDRSTATRRLVSRILDARGALAGDELVIASGPGRPGPHDVVAAPDGGVLFVGSAPDPAAGDHHVWLRRLGPDGTTLGPVVRVDEQASHSTTYPAVAVTPAGRVLVVWQAHLPTSLPGFYRFAIRGRWLDADGVPSAAEYELLDEPYPFSPHLAAHPDGGFVLTWAGGFLHQRLDAAGRLVGESEAAPPTVGTEHRLLGTPLGVFAANRSEDWTCPSDPTCVVPALTFGRLDVVPPVHVEVADYGLGPELAVHPSGAVYVAWQYLGVEGRWMAPDGSAGPPAEQLARGTHLAIDAAAAHDGRGDILVAWAAVATGTAAEVPVVLSARVLQIDSDGDGVYDVDDVCPEVADPGQVDADRDGLGAACDCDESDPANNALCLGPQGRFRFAVEWAALGRAGPGRPMPLTADSGAFWFFDAANLEVLVKVLDGCSLGGHFWVFAAGLTDVATTLTVTDRATSAHVTYRTTAGTPFPPRLDTAALPCP